MITKKQKNTLMKFDENRLFPEPLARFNQFQTWHKASLCEGDLMITKKQKIC